MPSLGQTLQQTTPPSGTDDSLGMSLAMRAMADKATQLRNPSFIPYSVAKQCLQYLSDRGLSMTRTGDPINGGSAILGTGQNMGRLKGVEIGSGFEGLRPLQQFSPRAVLLHEVGHLQTPLAGMGLGDSQGMSLMDMYNRANDPEYQKQQTIQAEQAANQSALSKLNPDQQTRYQAEVDPAFDTYSKDAAMSGGEESLGSKLMSLVKPGAINVARATSPYLRAGSEALPIAGAASELALAPNHDPAQNYIDNVMPAINDPNSHNAGIMNALLQGVLNPVGASSATIASLLKGQSMQPSQDATQQFLLANKPYNQ